MKVSATLSTICCLAAATTLLHAQPVLPVITDTKVIAGEFRFQISGLSGSNCVVQTAISSGGGLDWQNVGPASASFSTPVADDRVPHHFRVRCEQGFPVYSVNGATYYQVQPPFGFSMLSYPLETISNTASNLLPEVSEGTLLHWFDPAAQRLATAQFQFGRWSHPAIPLARGRAVLLWSPTNPNPFILHGTFSGGTHTNQLVLGFNLFSQPWPIGSSLPPDPFCGGAGRNALELIGTDNVDPVYRVYTELPPDWYDEQFNLASPPFPPFGGLWVYRPCPGGTWVETRTLPLTEGIPSASSGPQSSPKSASPASVYFNNYVPGFGIDARIVHTNGETPAGSNWLAQLHGGSLGNAENALVPAGDPLPFLSGDHAGYLDPSPGATRVLTNAAADGDSVAQIRYWDARTGSSYESATIKGRTPVFRIPTRFFVPTPAVPMVGLASPRLLVSRSMLPAVAHLTVHGRAGMAYSIETSAALSNWTAVAVVTNIASTSTFVEQGVTTNQHRFYRAKIFGPAP